MMLRRFNPSARLACGRHAQVVRLSASSQHWQPSSGPVAAALAAACLLMGSPAWAVIEDPPSGTPSTYEQELQQLIEARTGKTALPDLSEIPGEKAIQAEVERAFIEEAAAAEEEVVVVLNIFEEPVSELKEQAIRESLAAQKAAPAPETVITPATGAGPAGFSQSTVILVGAVATVGIAAVALSSSGSPAAAPAPPAAAPSDPPPAPATPPTDTTPPPPRVHEATHSPP